MGSRLLLAVLGIGAGCALVASPPLPASEETATAEELDCSACHRSRRAKRLNDLGMYYELTRTVAGYDELIERFARCSTCHHGRPGDKDLTITGRRYRWFFEDMDGIREWVMSRHPETQRPAAKQRGARDASDNAEQAGCPK